MTKGRDQGPERMPNLNSGAGVGSTSQSSDPKYYFGSPEEISNRIATGYKQDPKNAGVAFKQIPPADSGAGANDHGFESRSGNMKFSSGPKE